MLVSTFSAYKKETYESVAWPSVTTYRYDPMSQTVEVLKTRQDSDIEYRTTQYLDNFGRLTGGDHEGRSPTVSISHSYQLGYDDDGRMLSFNRNGGRSFDFIYEQGRLIEIQQSGVDNTRETKIFNYDDAGNLVSAYENNINVTYYYTCNAQNQISSLHAVRDGTNQGYYTIDYDDNGNLVEFKRHSRPGSVIYTRSFKYEISAIPTFNHWQLRMSMGLIPSVEQLVH